jgi:hypothetical protein
MAQSAAAILALASAAGFALSEAGAGALLVGAGAGFELEADPLSCVLPPFLHPLSKKSGRKQHVNVRNTFMRSSNQIGILPDISTWQQHELERQQNVTAMSRT